MLEFDTSSLGCELPICLGVMSIAVVFPGGDFVDEGLFVGDAAIETLSGEDTEFGFRQIEPTAVLGRVDAMGRAARAWHLRRWTSTDGAPHVTSI